MIERQRHHSLVAASRRWSVLLAGLAACLCARAHGETACRFYLANQSDSGNGITLFLESAADSSGVCSLSSVQLVLSAGKSGTFQRVVASGPAAWVPGVTYHATALVSQSGPQYLYLDGKLAGVLNSGFTPASAPLFASLVQNSPNTTQAYIVSQIALYAANWWDVLSFVPNHNDPIPLPSLLMSGPAPRQGPFYEAPWGYSVIYATFRFDSAPASLHHFDPYVDKYGQPTFTSWPTKVLTDNDLRAEIPEENVWVSHHTSPGGADAFGGSVQAGWTDVATGYFHVASHLGRFWLISPLGNPLFYIGLSAVYDNVTPITGRESMFAELPPKTPDFAPAYIANVWGDTSPTTYVSFDIANKIRKFGSTLQDSARNLSVTRILSWGFGGVGKSGGLPNLPRNPFLKHGDVANVVPGGHPDTFDSVTRGLLKASLRSQIIQDIDNSYIIGWSVGNEKKEIIGTDEIKAILKLGASVAAKRALVDYALNHIYGGSLSWLASSWGLSASTIDDVYAAVVSGEPDGDVGKLRQYDEDRYYAALYDIMKQIDPNHLYLGSWALSEDLEDFAIMAGHCDVIGFDDYSPTLKPELLSLISSLGKPVLMGEFSFPVDYGGMRGFGSSQYTNATMYSEADSGDVYSAKLLSAATNPYFVGAQWFEYRDEPICGRGNTDGSPYAAGSLVVGENYAFGLVDGTDRPKYELLEKVRRANLSAWQILGLRGRH